MGSELHAVQVDFEGLMEVLGKNLYSTPMVAVRELVQNAHDSCVRRELEDDAWSSTQAAIHIHTRGQVLEIQDNGAGLTHDEILAYLATVGAGYTRKLRQTHQGASLIGAFGLGFLSAYVLSDRVEVYTTSYADTARCLRFASQSGERFTIDEVEPITPGQAGTRVILHLSEPFHRLADPAHLTSILEHYCRLLPAPITINAASTPINGETAPWELDAGVQASVVGLKARLAFASHFERAYEPITAFALPPSGDGVVTGGLVWIQDGASYATSDSRNVHVFVRGMMVNPDERDLLPAWAGFVGAVVTSDELIPTASREDIMKDAHFDQATEHLRAHLIAGLEALPRREPAAWRRILRRHNEALLGAAISDPRLFSLLCDDLTVPTSEGDLRMPELRERGARVHVSTFERRGPEEVLFRALQTPIVMGTRYAAYPFVKRYCDERGIGLVEFGTEQGHASFFPEVPLSASRRRRLDALFAREGFVLAPTRFEPGVLPCVLVYDQQVKLKRRIEDDEADRRISTAVLGLARLHTRTSDDSSEATLYLNLEAPTVAALLDDERPVDDARIRQVARMIWSVATLMAPSADTSGRLEQTLHDLNDAMVSLLGATTAS